MRATIDTKQASGSSDVLSVADRYSKDSLKVKLQENIQVELEDPILEPAPELETSETVIPEPESIVSPELESAFHTKPIAPPTLTGNPHNPVFVMWDRQASTGSYAPQNNGQEQTQSLKANQEQAEAQLNLDSESDSKSYAPDLASKQAAKPASPKLLSPPSVESLVGPLASIKHVKVSELTNESQDTASSPETLNPTSAKPETAKDLDKPQANLQDSSRTSQGEQSLDAANSSPMPENNSNPLNNSATQSNSQDIHNGYKEYTDFHGNTRMVKLSPYYPEYEFDADDLFKESQVLLEGKNLNKDYVIKHGLFKKTIVHSVQDANFVLHEGETLSIVGESGSGKTTLAKIITNIERQTSGDLFFKGQKINPKATRSRELRKSIQIIFQNPHSSLNSRKTIFKILEEPLILNTDLTKAQRRSKIEEMITLVGLKPEHLNRLPHMFSGGQKQRIAIARGLILNPDIVVADEAVSALDVSVQAQIVNLMLELQQKYNLAYIFISHDLSVVKHISHKIMVMYHGEIVEYGTVDQIFNNPQHPYTKSLLDAIPKLPKCTIATPCTKLQEELEAQEREKAKMLKRQTAHVD